MTRKQSNFKPGDLVEMWNEELRYIGVGIYLRQIDLSTEWDLSQGGDCWVYINGDEYVFWHDELEHIDINRNISNKLIDI